MKIIFLDIDGVINSQRSCMALGDYPHDPKSTEFFDMIAVGLVQRVCRECDAQIVLSSTWRIHASWVELKYTFNLPIIDRTPKLQFGEDRNGEGRGIEIQRWLEANAEMRGVEKYVIVDDDQDFLKEQKEFFVHTSYLDGLSFADFMKMKRILGEEK